jgi:hypothetical protein
VKPLTKAELLREPFLREPRLSDEHPLGNFRYYLKSTEPNGDSILRFDNGYGALVSVDRREVTPISWRPDVKHVREYYDVSETVFNVLFDYLEIIQGWSSAPPPF